MTAIKEEIKKQGYTPVLNWWIDDLMPLIPNDEWRLLNRINRLIVGMDAMRVMQGKGSISHKDLLGITTGVNRPNNIVTALKNLVEWNVLSIAEKSKGGRGHRGTKYEITFDASLINWAKIEADYKARMLKNGHKISKETANSSVSSSTNKPLTVSLVVPEITANSSVKNKMAIYGFAMAQMPFFKEKAIYILINMHVILDLMKEKIFNLKPELNLKLTDELIKLIKEKEFNENSETIELSAMIGHSGSSNNSIHDHDLNLIKHETEILDFMPDDHDHESCVKTEINLTCVQHEKSSTDIYGVNVAEATACHSLALMDAPLDFNLNAVAVGDCMQTDHETQSSLFHENTVRSTESDDLKEINHAEEDQSLKEEEAVVVKKSRTKKSINSAAAENLSERAVTDSKPRKPRKTNTVSDEHKEWRTAVYNALLDERGGIPYTKVAASRTHIKQHLQPLMLNHGLTIADVRNMHRIISAANLQSNNANFRYREVYPIDLAKMFHNWVKDNRAMPKGVERWIDPSEKPAEVEKPKRQAVSKYERYVE